MNRAQGLNTRREPGEDTCLPVPGGQEAIFKDEEFQFHVFSGAPEVNVGCLFSSELVLLKMERSLASETHREVDPGIW